MKTTTPTIAPLYIKLTLNPSGRLDVWQKVKGIWKNRRPDPAHELKTMRRDWDKTTNK